MLTGDGNEKCNKKSIGLKSEKKSLHVQHIFLYISLPLFCTTSKYVKRPSCTFYGEKIVYVPTFHFCFTAAHFNLAGR